MKKSRAIITDHAVIRYLERVMSVDVEGLRRRIGKKVDTHLEFEAAWIVVDGVKYAIAADKKTVTTCFPINHQHPRKSRKKRGHHA